MFLKKIQFLNGNILVGFSIHDFENMKIANTLSKYFKKRQEKIIKLLEKPLQEYSKEDYRHLRVEIKKLNAVLDLIKGCSKNFKEKKYFKPVRKIFKQCGKVREFQLEESALKKYGYNSPLHYLYNLEERIKVEQDNLNSLINKKLKKKIKKTFEKMAPFMKMIHKKDLNSYFEKERNIIADLVRQKPLQPIRIHELRKRLKVDFYNKTSLNLPDNNNHDEEDNLQELLGKWHDGRTLNNHLEKSIIQEKTDPAELKQLIQIDREIVLNTQNLLEEINKQLETKNLIV